jgi:hypothetical protein
MKRKSLKERIAVRRALKKRLTAQRDYAFHLGWDELDPDLQAAKIEKYLTFNAAPEVGGDQYEGEDKEEGSRAWSDAEDAISAHFPIYF